MTAAGRGRATVLALVVALLVALAPAAQAAPGDCTRVIGFSQTRNWFVTGGFELVPGIENGEWELLAVGGADLQDWADPTSPAFARRVDSACGIPPTRVLLQASYFGYRQATDADIAGILATAIANIRGRLPSVTRVDVVPIVGGPAHTTCPLTPRRNVDASLMHPRIDTAIAAVANGVDVVAGPDLLVSACSDYSDGVGHLTLTGSVFVANAVALHYTGGQLLLLRIPGS